MGLYSCSVFVGLVQACLSVCLVCLSVSGLVPKDALHMDPGEGEGGPQANFGEDHQGTIFRTQEK